MCRMLTISYLTCMLLATNALTAIDELMKSSWYGYLYAVAGFVIIWLSAMLGMTLFSVRHPADGIEEAYEILTWLATTVGISLIAAQMWYTRGPEQTAFFNAVVGRLHVSLSILLAGLKYCAQNRSAVTVGKIVNTFTAASIMLNSLIKPNMYGIVGAISIAVVGLEFPLPGSMFGLSAVDYFNIGLTSGVTGTMHALLEVKWPNDSIWEWVFGRKTGTEPLTLLLDYFKDVVLAMASS